MRRRELETLGDPLVVLNRIAPWEMFRPSDVTHRDIALTPPR